MIAQIQGRWTQEAPGLARPAGRALLASFGGKVVEFEFQSSPSTYGHTLNYGRLGVSLILAQRGGRVEVGVADISATHRIDPHVAGVMGLRNEGVDGGGNRAAVNGGEGGSKESESKVQDGHLSTFSADAT